MLTLKQIDALATIFCYDAIIDGDKGTVSFYMDGEFLYTRSILR